MVRFQAQTRLAPAPKAPETALHWHLVNATSLLSKRHHVRLIKCGEVAKWP